MNHRIVKSVWIAVMLAVSAMSAAPGWSATVEQMKAERRNISKQVDRMDREIAAMKSDEQVLQAELGRTHSARMNPEIYALRAELLLNKDVHGWLYLNEKQINTFAKLMAVQNIVEEYRFGREWVRLYSDWRKNKERLVEISNDYKRGPLAKRVKRIQTRLGQVKQDIAQQQAARQKLVDRFLDLDNLLSGKKIKTTTGGFPLTWHWEAVCPSGKYKGNYGGGWSMSPPDLYGDFTGSFSGGHPGNIKGTVSDKSIQFKRTFMREGKKVTQRWTGSLGGPTKKKITGSLTDPMGGCSFTATAR